MYDRLTRQDVEKMEKELEHRKLVVRKEALEDVKEARAQGDLSENFEYKAEPDPLSGADDQDGSDRGGRCR